jgi:hypothetical protein
MFKKLLLVSLLGLLVACSSAITGEDYGKNVIASKNDQQIVGKKIIPVDLIEHNLSLKKSILFVTAHINGGDKKNKSTINYVIEYSTPKLPKDQSKEAEDNVNSYGMVVLNSAQIPDKLEAFINKKRLEQEKLDEKNEKAKHKGKHKKKKPVMDEPEVEKPDLLSLNIKNDSSESCSKTTCEVSQTVSFDIDTQLLEDAQKNGFVFLLKPNQGDVFIETKIPASYLEGLFAPSK